MISGLYLISDKVLWVSKILTTNIIPFVNKTHHHFSLKEMEERKHKYLLNYISNKIQITFHVN